MKKDPPLPEKEHGTRGIQPRPLREGITKGIQPKIDNLPPRPNPPPPPPPTPKPETGKK